jgi:Xaa-Pro aminopeptidase
VTETTDANENTVPDAGGEATTASVDESPDQTHTESHDPAVPEAYASFMRTGWGERELDVPAHPITQ